ncbi:von Willebrand factor type A [Calothrix sp. NIES-4071]|nr:von Willebrand factor type A [Calothrix sp. NIES-4071]BAZ60425.1 von Willebrand factor type A [Calothrix sp. NIES-4105]
MPRNIVNPGSRTYGGLFAKGSEQLFPLKHTEVGATITGNVARVEVTQSFENPFTKHAEAVYVFPLPDESAVDEMEIRIGEKIIKGSIKKRAEAQEIYEKAKKEGRTAGLLEQERDNIFTQSLANILPGEQIDVTIRYTDSLKFDAGSYEFVFPMVVGPRYIPGELIPPTPLDKGGEENGIIDTDLVPDASRISPPVIPPGMRSGHDINLTVQLDGGVVVTEIKSPSHQLEIEHIDQIALIKLGVEDTIPNKDFILRYQVAQNETQSTVLTQADERGGHFAVYLIPALEYQPSQIVPKDVVFLVDTSGSQSGAPLQQCQELMRRFINGLNPQDSFAILDFSDKVRQLSQAPLSNTHENRQKAINYINKLEAGGATEMLGGIKKAVNFPAPAGRLRTVVLLSDGYIGNENEILAEVQSTLQPGNRLYSFGAGSSVNRFLLNRIAEIGRGVSYIIRYDETTDEVTKKFFRQINNPVLTNIQISWEGEGEAPLIYPAQPPDLFAEQPLVLFGRKQDSANGHICIRGNTVNSDYEKVFPVNFASGNAAVAQLWARARIKSLTNEMFAYETTAKVEAVTDIALTYQLLSQYTAFVAVSEEVRVNPNGESVKVEVPVEIPQGVNYETAVGSSQRAIFGEMARGITAYSLAAAPSPSSVDMPDFLRRRPAAKASSPAYTAHETQINPQIKVISITGLEDAVTHELTNYLESQNIPEGYNGQVVIELQLNKGRIQQVSFDEDASTLKAVKILAAIRRLLVSWRTSQPVTATARITLDI